MPFIKTAPLHNEDENIIHCAAIRLRVQGFGQLIPTLLTQDDIRSSQLAIINMSAETDKEQTRLGNFKSQRITLKLHTENFDELFKINRILVFVKEVETSYPAD